MPIQIGPKRANGYVLCSFEIYTDEVTHRLKKEWAADIKTVDLNETHLIHMSDFLTDGIVKQFPEKFK